MQDLEADLVARRVVALDVGDQMRTLEAELDSRAVLLSAAQEEIEQCRWDMRYAADDQELQDLNAVFNSPAVQKALGEHPRMMEFLKDQLR